ncbi:MAG: outer membrane beta-barrel protein [Bacteroidaceae bacterium]|nr:outer membrane beta-barrel protein [Bacteroidaceae bacterium]
MKKNFFRCGNLRILLLLCLIASIQTTHADIVKGRVVDAETQEPMPEVLVKHTQQFGDNSYSIRSTKTDSLGCFTLFADGRGTIEVSMLGYNSKSKPVLAFGDSRKDTLDIGDIELKMLPQMLKMVEVAGHARRFTVKGDTIVFHPEAFHLLEGTRLDELIKQLPGVQVNDDGKLSWNGKPIRITMDGESLFGGDDLVKQLPAEAVENIKAYNKQSEFSERTGKDDGGEDMVLDLTIKPGFLDRWYGDIRAYYQSPKHYEGELVMNRLSKTDPIMVFANANNIDKHWRRNMNGSMANMGNGFGQEQGASAGYQHNWQRKEGTHELKNYYSFTGGVAHDDDWRTSHQLTENYFPNTVATRTTSEDYQRDHKLEPRLNANLRWVRDSLNTFTLSTSAEHRKNRAHNRQSIEQEEMTATDAPYATTLSQLTASHTNGHTTKLSANAGWEHYVKDGALGASVNLNYQDDKTEGQTDRTITAHSLSYNSSQFIQTYIMAIQQLSTTAEVHHARWLTKRWMMQAQYVMTYNRDRNDRNFLTNGVTDAANSYHNLYNRNEHSLRISQTINLTPVQLMPNISVRWQRECLDYQRGILDTATVRHHFFIDPSLRATWKLSKTAGIELNYGFTTKQPDILQTIGYRDLTDPLFITEGNPALRYTHTHDMKLTYNMVLAHSQTSLSVTIGHVHNDRETITVLSYDPATAIYISRPENVRGSQSWNFHLNFDQALGDYLRLQSDFRMNTSQRYGYLTLLPTQPERIENRQSSMNPRENLTLSFDHNWLKASIFAEINADRLRYTASPEQNTTHWNNNFGLRIEATHGNFFFYTSLTERTYRGYTISSMNRNILAWDGSVGWNILKKKARLMLEFNDILNNEDGRMSQQTAYQQTTSWREFRHHYVGLSFRYHLDAKVKE